MRSITPPPRPPNAALREIGGRLKSLSYLDMMKLAKIMFDDGLEVHGHTFAEVPLRLISVAEKLENA